MLVGGEERETEEGERQVRERRRERADVKKMEEGKATKKKERNLGWWPLFVAKRRRFVK